jgi:hypothetical protein
MTTSAAVSSSTERAINHNGTLERHVDRPISDLVGSAG